jgi:Reverse transcriptase (RNA-dependent DNA polymerase)
VPARFVKHCDQNPLFPVRQSAFRLHHSTETAHVLIVHNDVVRAIDNGQLTVMLFLDLSSVFDTVNHDIILSILHRRFSVDGVALNWFQSYLTDRSQTFSVGDSKSISRSVNCSVPQGSVLGPVEFVAYTENVSDLFDQYKVNHHLYDDDQHIYLHTEPAWRLESFTRLVDCFSDLSGWCASRRLQLNTAKTELIWFGLRALTLSSDLLQPLSPRRLHSCEISRRCPRFGSVT